MSSLAEFFGALFPNENNVVAGVSYGPIDVIGNAGDPGTMVGILDPAAGLPGTQDVRDGVVFGGGEGTLELPNEIYVRDGIGYGANGIEYVGALEIGMLLPNSPVVNGRLSTLWTNVDYVTQYGNGFAWTVDTGFDATTGSAFFRGKLQQCSCALEYAWEVEELNIVAVTDGYEFQFDMLETDSPSVTGRYNWWLVWESATGEQIVLRSGSVDWECG